MAADNKFGTFGGVFTPSILTILGVIMYLRLPWVVGNGGMYLALLIIAVAHVISICTGLSISSIATDKKVGAGGPYYIVSRSLGLPIGGTLGVALFLGLAFSISLYVIGFSESFLSYWGLPNTPAAIRICGTITLVVLTIVTLVSTAVAIKTQYLIMVLIGASLLSIVFGSHASPPARAQLEPVADGASVALMFGIFFPAVTGFTAGVNMSGDLRDPTKSIPRGTMLAIVVGLVAYIGLAVLLSVRVPAQALIHNPDILLEISVSAPAVVAGIWGATLSSAMGSILGAPRILQAVAADRIAPRWFAKGYGPSHEPRNALLIAFAIGEAGVLIAELNAIARIVSMVFLTTYGVLNLSCAIESWVSPDFRPAFKIPKTLSVIGAVTCVLVMIQLDLLAMLGATAFMAALWLLLSRRQLTLDAGDAWEGIWSSLVRSGLQRLSRVKRQQRNWRPNILLFRTADEEHISALQALSSSLVSGTGMVTELVLGGEDGAVETSTSDDLRVGVFLDSLPAADPYQTIADVCRYRGFAGVEPNTALLDWHALRSDPDGFGELLDVISQLEHNLLVHAHGAATAPNPARRIDVWWRADAGNAPLCLALLRFITRARDRRDTKVRFLLLSPDSAANDHLRATMRGLLSNARVEATIRIINHALRTATFHQRIIDESLDAELTILGLPNDADGCGPSYQQGIDQLLESLGSILLVRANSTFDEVLSLSRQATVSFLPPVSTDGTAPDLPEIDLPVHPQIAKQVSALADGYQLLGSRHQRACMQRVYGTQIKLLRNVRQAVDKYLGGLDKQLAGANPRRQRNLINRARSSLLHECHRLIGEFADKGLAEQRSVLEGRINSYLDSTLVVDEPAGRTPLVVHRPRERFAADPGDDATLRRVKRRARLRALAGGSQVRCRLPVAPLKDFYFERSIDCMLGDTVGQFITDSHQLMVQLGKMLSSSLMSLAAPAPTTTLSRRPGAAANGSPDDEGWLTDIDEQRGSLLDRLDELVEHHKQRVARHQWTLLAQSRALVRDFAADIDRLDVRVLVRRERRVDPKEARQRRASLRELGSSWQDNQRLIVERARLGLDLSSFQHRLASTLEREKQSIMLQIRNGALAECRKLTAALQKVAALAEAADDGALDRAAVRKLCDVHLDFSRRFDATHVADSLAKSTADLADALPQTAHTLTDDAIGRLEEGQTGAMDTVEVPVLRLAQFLVEAKLLGRLQGTFDAVPGLEQRAAGVAYDIMRLVSFQLGELPASDDDDNGAYDAQLSEVIDGGIARLQGEIEGLDQILHELGEVADHQLAVVLDGTNPYDLSRSAADLEQHIRRHHGKRAVSGLRAVALSSVDRARDAVVKLMYRRSAVLLRTHELRADATRHGKLVDRLVELVERHQPRPEVLEQLPPYYRQLFMGQAMVNDSFWVGREQQLSEAKRAVARAGRGGAGGALFVIGERSSGKSSLIGRLATDLLSKRATYRVFAPRGGSVDAADFAAAVGKAMGVEGEPDKLLGGVADGSVVIIDDLELWWERSARGLVVVDQVRELIERHGRRLLFMLGVGTQPFELMRRFRPLADDALAVLECGPVPAEVLAHIIRLRHGSTGMSFELDGRAEDEIGDFGMARLFSAHFAFSKGQVGAALRSWVAHVERVTDSTISVRTPDVEHWELIDQLRRQWVALLVQLVLHKQLDGARLARVSGLAPETLDRQVDTLLRLGLLVRSQRGVIDINPFIHHMVVQRLKMKGLLS